MNIPSTIARPTRKYGGGSDPAAVSGERRSFGILRAVRRRQVEPSSQGKSRRSGWRGAIGRGPAGKRGSARRFTTLRPAAARERPERRGDQKPRSGTVPPAALTPLTEQQGKLARDYDEEQEA